MGKDTGFKEWSRETPRKRPPDLRIRDHQELYLPVAEEVLRQQGGRCMDCGVPFCHQGCPLGNLIPDWNDLVFRGRWHAAYRALAETNCFPEFTGRLCPAPCEASCVLSINSSPVTIEEIEKQIVECAFAEGWVKPQVPVERSGKTVAVVGSGPAGLAAASQLNQAGHTVTVFESAEQLGGLLRYGIPDFKLEKWVIDRRLDLLRAEGLEFRTNTTIGRDQTWTDLKASFDAVVIAIGARRPRDLDVPGRSSTGVHFAMDYLSQQNRVVSGLEPIDLIDAEKKRVVILGGGDTGSDCYGTAIRQGASNVLQIELMPAPPDERRPGNPWPQWPLVFRTSSSHEEGGKRAFALMTKEIVAADGRVKVLRTVDIEVVDGSLREIPGSSNEIPCDLLLLAMGFTGFDASSLVDELAIDVERRGNIAVGEDFQTNVPGLFCAGDAMRGASLIVWAISDGRETARHVDSYLTGAPSRLASRGGDDPF